jgi:hypothetical protein
VNEIQLIRAQLDTERDRAGAVVQACARALASADLPTPAAGSAIAAFHRAALAYLTRVLTGFDARDQRLREVCVHLTVDDPDRSHSLEKVLAEGSSGREALARLESAVDRQELWQELSRFVTGPWKTRRDAIDRALASRLRVADWRAIAGVDADSILEERRLYAQVRQHLPPGMAATAGL